VADEQYIVEFTSRFGSYEQGVEALVKSHAQLATQFDRVSRSGDRVEKQMLGLTGAQRTATQQAQNLNRSTRDLNDNLISQRYALYDVATTYGAIGAALVGASAYAVIATANFEKAFTGVERTFATDVLPSSIENIRQELLDLSTQIPLTFADLSTIATLGNQLGIAEADLTSFTETVAQFSAITGISVEQTALAFGQLGNLLGVLPSEFDNLASSIALVGVNSAATEQQIVAVAREIAPAARAAGFTADQVIGLSGALASIRVPPERSRSTILQFFETLNMAVAGGGEDLQNFATAVGVTTTELDRMVRAGEGESILRQFIDNAAASDTIEITQALEALGLAGLRTNPTIRALADSQELLNSTFSDAAQGFADGTEQARQYALIADDLASRFQMLVNAVNAFIVAATAGNIDGLSGLVAMLIEVTNAARDFVSTPLGQTVARLVLGLTLLVGVLAALRAANALATASTYALITAKRSLVASSGASALGIKGLIGVLLGYDVTAKGAITTTGLLTTAIRTLAKATLILAALDFAFRLITDFEGLSDEVDNVTGGVFGLQDALDGLGTKMVQIGDLSLGVEDGMIRIGEAAISASDALLIASGPLGAIVGLWQAFNRETGAAGNRRTDGVRVSRGGSFGSNADDLAAAEESANGFAGALDKVGGAAGGAGRQVRTLLDYASDLGQVIDRSFDIRFGSQAALDQVTTSWIDLNEQMAEYQRKVQELTADRAIQAYFLSVAEAYGDTLRAGELRSNIADIDAELADATAGASTQLKGNSKAAIENRKRITDLLAGYGDYIEALAASGASQATINAAIAKSRAEFLAQAQALGYSNAQLRPYIRSFDDMAIAIARVPRNVTVTANTNPALQALNELEARFKSLGGKSFPGPRVTNPTNSKEIRRMALEAAIVARTAWMHQLIKDRNLSGANNAELSITRMRKDLASGNYWSGGYTGNGGKYEPKGVVHGGEFVMTKKAVNNAGVGQMYAMMRAFETGRGYAMGGYVPAPIPASGGGMMGLSPQDRGILRGILDSVREIQPGYLPDELISRASQRGDTKRKAQGELG
jgi:TP901 family phage tail tape measure protein